jgi:lysophospholipase L1-like esterase
MNKVLSLLLILVLLTFAGVAYAAPKAESPANTDKECTNYVALGDSISVGLSASDDEGYVDLFFEYLAELEGEAGYRNLKLRNRAIVGDTSSDLLEAITHDEHISTKIKKS